MQRFWLYNRLITAVQIDQLVTHNRFHYFVGNNAGTVTGIEKRATVFQLKCGISNHADIFITVILFHHVKTAEYCIRFAMIQRFICVQDILYAMMSTTAEQNAARTFLNDKTLLMVKGIRYVFFCGLSFQRAMGQL